ncbi:MAG: ScpA family protein [Kiloniellales bacterium]|nr:ScpA family protein [Kiloniellales bacterium]
MEPWEDPVRTTSDDFVVDLDGYDGPIDVLLKLAREQRVDLTRISILALADQYLEFVRRSSRLRLEPAADYLVMAAWLAYLKSKLLLPEPEDPEEPSAAEMAAALRHRLQRLEAMKEAGRKLLTLPRLGQERFSRGEPEGLKRVTRSRHDATLYDLLKAYGEIRGRARVSVLQVPASDFFSVEQAMNRLTGLIGETPGWRSLAAFLPADLRGGLIWRSAIAATFAASLELCREGKLKVRQDQSFGPIFVSPQGPES